MAFAVTFTHQAGPTNLASWTVSNAAIGAADPGRMVVVQVGWSTTQTLNSVTIGGVPATLAALSTGDNARTSLWCANIPTGTTANIQVVWASNVTRGYINVMRAVGVKSLTPIDTDQPTGGGDASRSITIDAPEGGGIVFASIGDENQRNPTITNATKLNEIQGSFETVICGVYHTVGATQANRVITVNGCRAICGAAWEGASATVAPKAMHYRRLRI